MQNLTQCRTHFFHLKQQSRIFWIILDKLPIKNLIESQIQRMDGLGNKVWTFDGPIMKQIAVWGNLFLKIILTVCELRRRSRCNSTLIRDLQTFWVESTALGWQRPWPRKGLRQTTSVVIVMWTGKQKQRDTMRDWDSPADLSHHRFHPTPESLWQ